MIELAIGLVIGTVVSASTLGVMSGKAYQKGMEHGKSLGGCKNTDMNKCQYCTMANMCDREELLEKAYGTRGN